MMNLSRGVEMQGEKMQTMWSLERKAEKSSEKKTKKQGVILGLEFRKNGM